MEAYDDRPISVYDNLNNMPTTMHTSTPKPKSPQTTSTSATTDEAVPVSATNGAARSPYAEIQFKFNDNNNKATTTAQQLLPNGNRSQTNNQQQQQTSSQVQSPSTAYYATPFKKATTTAPTSPTAPATTTTAKNTNATATNNNPVQRPLSQHSQTELNEASQSIAAVKAALNDAKSKFFGFNSSTQDDSPLTHSNESHKPKVQILTPPPKNQPKYQNIPENSAIFRNNQQQPPPELPPKPADFQRYHSLDIDGLHNAPACSPATTSSSPPLSDRISIDPSTPTPSKMSSSSPSTSASSPAKILPLASYKQIPLNDIDGPQPSQAVYMSTTVPQNIKGSKIAGRHTPTRNSLRHSRMLVVNNKNYQGTQYPNPMQFRYPNLARWLLILQILIGLLICCLAIWILFLAPNTSIQDNPYWSGLALLLAGILGLVLIRYQRIKRRKVRENCFLFLRADSFILTLLAVLLCVVALFCASLHYARLTASDTRCVSTNILLEHGSCSCTFNAVESASNITDQRRSLDYETNGLLVEENEGYEDNSYIVEYRDLSCGEVNGEWTYILGLSITLNSLGFLSVVLYILLLACCRHNSKRIYSSVHTSTF